MAQRLYGIVGPTASGKTGLAIELCQRLNAEIISADSMQIYQGMNILSAQPSQEEINKAPHHLIGMIPASSRFDANKYRDYADKAISEVVSKGKLPLLCGGTGLYIDSLTKAIKMSEEADPCMRERLKALSQEENGAQKLHEMLMAVDSESALKYPAQDVRRVIRSLEIFYTTGKPRSESERLDKLRPDRYEAHLFALKWDRDRLYERINLRVDEMLKNGLIDEVKKLMNADAAVQETAAQAIGFKEIKAALDGEVTMEEAIENVKLNSRHLAKRQETWFRRDGRVMWIEANDKAADTVYRIIREDMKANECK